MVLFIDVSPMRHNRQYKLESNENLKKKKKGL